MTRCKLQAKKCNFRDASETDERLIEQLTVGIKHARIQEKLLSHDATLTLDDAMDMARTFEATMTDIKQFNGETTINQINHKRYTKQQHQSCVMDRDGWSGKFHLCSLVIKKLLQFQISL